MTPFRLLSTAVVVFAFGAAACLPSTPGEEEGTRSRPRRDGGGASADACEATDDCPNIACLGDDGVPVNARFRRASAGIINTFKCLDEGPSV